MEDFKGYIVARPARSDGPWSWVAAPGLDPDAPEVQALAYRLLCEGYTWKGAMFGGDNKAVEAVDKVAKVSGGDDGRWFASTVDVRDAADAFRRLHNLPHWRAVVAARRRGEPVMLALPA